MGSRREKRVGGKRAGEVVGAAPGERFLFSTVQRRLGRWRVLFIMYCPGGKVGGAG